MNVNRAGNAQRRETRIYIPYEKEKKGASWIVIAICALSGGLMPLALLLLLNKIYNMMKNRRVQNYRRYANIIGNRCEIDISELSAKSGKMPIQVMNELNSMISKGYLGNNAYIDHNRGVLVLEPIPEPQPEPKPVRPAPEPPKPAKPQPEPMWKEDDFEAKLRQLRHLNDRIDDEKVSQTIDRIGSLTASIFDLVRQKPEHSDDVKKFMTYYLPTTIKLLESYALMERQGVQSPSILESRRKIEEMLENIAAGFEQLQDRMFRADALDLDADIQVMETMLAKDGLLPQKGLDINSVRQGK